MQNPFVCELRCCTAHRRNVRTPRHNIIQYHACFHFVPQFSLSCFFSSRFILSCASVILSLLCVCSLCVLRAFRRAKMSPGRFGPNVDTRLFWEDIPFGLCILKNLAGKLPRVHWLFFFFLLSLGSSSKFSSQGTHYITSSRSIYSSADHVCGV